MLDDEQENNHENGETRRGEEQAPQVSPDEDVFLLFAEDQRPRRNSATGPDIGFRLRRADTTGQIWPGRLFALGRGRLRIATRGRPDLHRLLLRTIQAAATTLAGAVGLAIRWC